MTTTETTETKPSTVKIEVLLNKVKSRLDKMTKASEPRTLQAGMVLTRKNGSDIAIDHSDIDGYVFQHKMEIAEEATNELWIYNAGTVYEDKDERCNLQFSARNGVRVSIEYAVNQRYGRNRYDQKYNTIIMDDSMYAFRFTVKIRDIKKVFAFDSGTVDVVSYKVATWIANNFRYFTSTYKDSKLKYESTTITEQWLEKIVQFREERDDKKALEKESKRMHNFLVTLKEEGFVQGKYLASHEDTEVEVDEDSGYSREITAEKYSSLYGRVSISLKVTFKGEWFGLCAVGGYSRTSQELLGGGLNQATELLLLAVTTAKK